MVPLPSIGDFAQRIYDQMVPLQYAEAVNDYALLRYTGSLGPMFQEIDDYASDGDNGEVGWSVIIDVERAPAKALPWLAQFVGVSIDDSLSEADQRLQIKNVAGFNRGTPNALAAAAQRHLTGAKDVIMIERYTGKAWQLYMATRTAQTPSSARTLADILTQKPAGIILTYQTLTGQSFQDLLAVGTFQNVFTTYTTMQGVLTGVPGT